MKNLIATLTNNGVFAACMVGYLVGFLLFGLIMGLGFVGCMVLHAALWYDNKVE